MEKINNIKKSIEKIKILIERDKQKRLIYLESFFGSLIALLISFSLDWKYSAITAIFAIVFYILYKRNDVNLKISIFLLAEAHRTKTELTKESYN